MYLNIISNPTYLVGDKDFIINKNKINNKYISIVTPKKTNQKIKHNNDENNKNVIAIYVYNFQI